MDNKKLLELIPQNKFDTSTLCKLRKLDEKEISFILPELFLWIADYNWPIAEDVGNILVKYPNSLIHLIKKALEVKEEDDILKYWIIIKILTQLPHKVQQELYPTIKRICEYPSATEVYEGVQEAAIEYMKNLLKKKNCDILITL